LTLVQFGLAMLQVELDSLPFFQTLEVYSEHADAMKEYLPSIMSAYEPEAAGRDAFIDDSLHK